MGSEVMFTNLGFPMKALEIAESQLFEVTSASSYAKILTSRTSPPYPKGSQEHDVLQIPPGHHDTIITPSNMYMYI